MGVGPLSANRDYKLLWFGGLLAGFGSHLAALALPLLVLAQWRSPGVAGLVGSLAAATTVLALVPAGALADATERRGLMLFSQVVLSGLAATLGALVLAGRAVLPLVLAVAVLGAAAAAPYTAAAAGLLRAAVPEEHLGTAIARLQARTAGARIAAPAAGGLLFAVSPALPFLIEAAALLGAAGCLAAVRARAPGRRGERSPFSFREMGAGFAFLWRQRYLRAGLLVVGVALNGTFAAIMLAVIATSGLADPSGRTSGVIVTLMAVGMLVGSLLAPRVHAETRPRAAILATCWTAAVTLPWLALAPGSLVAGVVIGACLLVAAAANVAFASIALLVTPDHLLGRMQSAASAVSSAVQPVGPLAGGLALAAFGPARTFLGFGAVVVAVAVAATLAPGLRVRPDRQPVLSQAR